MKKNPNIKKIVDSEKEDLKTLGKLVKGEKVNLRFDIKDLDPLKLLADNWLMSIILLCFFIGGFFLGTVAFQSVCNDALLEVQDDCNEFYRGSDTAWMTDLFNSSGFSISSNSSIIVDD